MEIEKQIATGYGIVGKAGVEGLEKYKRVCTAIANGEPVKDALIRIGIPYSLFMELTKAGEEFRTMYETALDICIETLRDNSIKIADSSEGEPKEKELRIKARELKARAVERKLDRLAQKNDNIAVRYVEVSDATEAEFKEILKDRTEEDL